MNLESNTEANVQQTVPFLWVANIHESVDWCVEGLGFDIREQWVQDGELRWCWLSQGGASLMLQQL